MTTTTDPTRYIVAPHTAACVALGDVPCEHVADPTPADDGTMPATIRTDYLGPDSAGRGARVTAVGVNPNTGRAARRTYPYDYAAGPEGSHVAAAVAFAVDVMGCPADVAPRLTGSSYRRRTFAADRPAR